MPAIAIPGPEGRLEARFSPPPKPRAPVAMILHPHPQAGGTMNDRITQAMYKTFVARGFAVLRFNFRGVGRSEGEFDNGVGELSDAASALDWVQSFQAEASTTCSLSALAVTFTLSRPTTAIREKLEPFGFQHLLQPQIWLCAVCALILTSTGFVVHLHFNVPPAKLSAPFHMPPSTDG